ncbi:hypothetical protein [Henriciella litoralis]|uniref:hypothetical protein n=1 Tax=Henriciella litoralis TaxID=568102 RepID=UPI000A01AD0F|nr:hypothetical protein [Henriciella litoralis]
MILQRLSQSIRKQDWFTVLIETLIVVFGVFIGLQVNNWNASRVARAEAGDLLARMLIEAQETQTDLADYQAIHAGILDRAIQLSIRLTEVERCLAMDDDTKELVLGVGDFPPPRFSLATASEAIGSGHLAVIGSGDIREEVRRIIDEMTFLERQWQRYIRVKQDSELAIYTAAGLSLVRDEKLQLTPGGDTWEGVDQYRLQTPEGICGKSEMVAFASNAATTQHIYTRYMDEVSATLEAYAALLAAEAGTTHETGEAAE